MFCGACVFVFEGYPSSLPDSASQNVEGSSKMFTRTAGDCAAGMQNNKVNLCEVRDALQNSQKCRVL